MPASGVAFQELPITGAAITFVLVLIISLIFALAFTCGGHDSEERTRHAAARPDNETASRPTHYFRSTFPSGTATEPISLAMPYASRVTLYMIIYAVAQARTPSSPQSSQPPQCLSFGLPQRTCALALDLRVSPESLV
jgi:hypothetical protein